MSNTKAQTKSQDIQSDAAAAPRGLSAKALKWIAMITMVIDHSASALLIPLGSFMLFPDLPLEQIYHVMRMIGRVSFPLFIYLIVDSFFYTKDRRRFIGGLFIFSLISEIPFDLTITIPVIDHFWTVKELFYAQNIYFTLLIGVLCLFFSEYVFNGRAAFISDKEVQNEKKKKHNDIPSRPLALDLLLAALITLAGCGLAYVMHVDYGFYGVLGMVLAYLIHKTGHKKFEIIGIVPPMAFSSIYELYGFIAGIAIFASNGRRGNIRHKWFYYIFYPAHLAVLALIKLMISYYAGAL
jgi:hypothetical protein